MLFHAKSKPPLALETIAFADIVINLFVFFFITFGLFATFDARDRGTLPIELPNADHALTNTVQKPLTVMVARNGAIYLGSQRVLRSVLPHAVDQELSLRKEKTVFLQADRKIPFELFVSVLDLLRGTKAISVAIEASTSGPQE